MKNLNLLLFVLSAFFTFSQAELLTKMPNSPEEFKASEKKVLATIDWLESTPINEQRDKRDFQNAALITWITNSPTVTVEVNADILTFIKKNPDLLVIFMGGWTRYSLQNNYSKDVVEGTIAGLKSAIKVYKTGLLKKDKAMQAYVDMDDKGELESYVKSKLKK